LFKEKKMSKKTIEVAGEEWLQNTVGDALTQQISQVVQRGAQDYALGILREKNPYTKTTPALWNAWDRGWATAQDMIDPSIGEEVKEKFAQLQPKAVDTWKCADGQFKVGDKLWTRHGDDWVQVRSFGTQYKGCYGKIAILLAASKINACTTVAFPEDCYLQDPRQHTCADGQFKVGDDLYVHTGGMYPVKGPYPVRSVAADGLITLGGGFVAHRDKCYTVYPEKLKMYECADGRFNLGDALWMPSSDAPGGYVQVRAHSVGSGSDGAIIWQASSSPMCAKASACYLKKPEPRFRVVGGVYEYLCADGWCRLWDKLFSYPEGERYPVARTVTCVSKCSSDSPEVGFDYQNPTTLAKDCYRKNPGMR